MRSSNRRRPGGASTGQVADKLFLPLVAKLARVSSSDDPDPALREKIGALVQKKMAEEPEWAALFERIPDVKIE